MAATTDAHTQQTPRPPPELTKEEIVSEDIREAILKNLNRPGIELVGFEAGKGSEAGDGYASAMYSVQLHLKDTVTGKLETVSIMLKKFPPGEFMAKAIAEMEIFVRDINFYDKVGPAMVKFQKDAGIEDKDLLNCWPKCFACKTDGSSDYLAMEDLKVEGFRMADRKVGLDFEHCKLALESQARFHATTYAMFGGDYDKIVEKYPWLKEKMYAEVEEGKPTFVTMLEKTYEQLVPKLKEIGSEKGALFLQKTVETPLGPKLRQLSHEKVKWAVVGHGDCWTNNLLFRYDEKTGKPIEVKFVDFQINRAGSRGLDIQYFLYASAQIQVLNEREEELESIYYSEFTRFAKKLGVNIEAHSLTKENLKAELTYFRFYGCLLGIMLAMFTTADKKDAPDFSKMTEETVQKGDVEDMFMGMLQDAALVKVRNIAERHFPRCPQLNC